MKLQVLQKIPEGFLDAGPTDLLDLLGGPTIIDLPGKDSSALFVSTLLHGNEHSGFFALKQVLKAHMKAGDLELPRGLCIFIGNVEAAAVGLRKLIHQPDYNRIWNGCGGREGGLAQEVIAYLDRKTLFAAVDIHNNTGRNPHYSCIARTDPSSLQLAALFGRLSTFFTKPESTMTVAMAQRAHAITLECGLSEDPGGAAHAAEYITSCLHLREIPPRKPSPDDLTLFHTIARIRMVDGSSFCFSGEKDEAQAEVVWAHEVDRLNFSEVESGAILGWYKGDGYQKIVVDTVAEFGEHAPVLRFNEGRIELTRTLTPSMITLNRRIIREDCFGYLMEDMPLSSF